MGWCSTYKPRHQTTKEWVKSNFTWEKDYEIIDIAAKLTCVYIAVRNKKDDSVSALIVLIHHNPRAYYNLSYKSMDEFCGPGETGCPERILKLLTPLDDEKDPNGWARNWRQKCWDKIFAVKNSKGKDYIITDSVVSFNNGSSFRCFRKLKTRRGCWLGVWINEKTGELQESYGVYKFNHKHYGFNACTKEMALQGLKNIEENNIDNL